MLLRIKVVVADGWVSWAPGYLDEAAATFRRMECINGESDINKPL
jgi:hypothetical protein